MVAFKARERVVAAPQAAGFAGVIFALLMGASIAVVRSAFPAGQDYSGAVVASPSASGAIHIALHLVPFAGITFLWFIGVFRDRLGGLEDRFFVTVILGSGFLFVACVFGAAVMAGCVMDAVTRGLVSPADREVYYFGRSAAGMFLNVFGIKMAGVFIFSTSTLALRTAILPRWVSLSGFGCGLVLLLVITRWLWIAMLFPVWILLISTTFLIKARESRKASTSGL